MIKYSEKLSEFMKSEKTFIQSHGIEIQTKSIPDEPREGYLDPRQYEILKASSDFFEEHSQNDKPSIQEMRDSMGFPNLNMNTVEIYTKFEEHIFDGNSVKIWTYYPRKPERKKNRAGFIYIHGGGFIGGTTFTVENPCKLLAERADCVVFNVDYSLAPEKKFPNGFNDCFNTLKYIYENAEKYGVDKNKIGIGGDSAGGNLAAACALKDKNEGTSMLKLQVLIYPAVSLVYAGIPDYKWSLAEYNICEEQKNMILPCLNLGKPSEGLEIDPLSNLYLESGQDPHDQYISPILAPSFKGLCKTLIGVAEFDGLRIQGENYGKKLKESGVDTRIIRYKGVTHAFFDKLGVLPQTEDFVQEMANEILTL